MEILNNLNHNFSEIKGGSEDLKSNWKFISIVQFGIFV